MSQVPVFGLACDVFCVLHRFSVAGRPIFEDLQRYEAPPTTLRSPTCDGLPWADSVLPLQAVPKYDGMTWNTESATTHQSLASNCLSVTYLQYIPRSIFERGMYYNSHSHNNLATKKPALGLACDVFCVLHRFSIAGRPIFEDLQRYGAHLQRYEASPATVLTLTCSGTGPHLQRNTPSLATARNFTCAHISILLAAEQPITYVGMR